ncbi:uncharacterized protein LOC133305021 [Gastrolobium bilobum]|uniref:uncharacterized protein LOC133305021 n=1 Tax=Gastrolobium bilobum TaxID=150636 RepID=UPI002AAF5F09|nr:uncharacterized protein LOC133305021 [Gastrolobium bilobum]
MNFSMHVPASETTSFWTDEKHVHFLNTMEASFVRTMLESKGGLTRRHHHHNQHFLRLDRHVPDSSESTLDLKPYHRRCTRKSHATSDSMGSTGRRTRRRSSQPCNSSHDQVVPQVEIQREGAASNGDHDDTRAEN